MAMVGRELCIGDIYTCEYVPSSLTILCIVNLTNETVEYCHYFVDDPEPDGTPKFLPYKPMECPIYVQPKDDFLINRSFLCHMMKMAYDDV